MTAPTPGSTVQYCLTADDADAIIRDRQTFAFRRGNRPATGDVVPMVVVKVHPDESVNGQALLDGNDALWVTSVHHGDGPGDWSYPALLPAKAKAAPTGGGQTPPSHPLASFGTSSTATPLAVSTASHAAGDGFDVVGPQPQVAR